METPQCGSSADIIRLATYFPTLSKQTSWQMVEYFGSSNLDYLSFFHVTDLHLEKALSPIHLVQKGIDKTISTTAIVIFIFYPRRNCLIFYNYLQKYGYDTVNQNVFI